MPFSSQWPPARAAHAVSGPRSHLRCTGELPRAAVRGAALPWVLIILAAASLGVGLLWKQQRDVAGLLTRNRRHRQAFYRAEAGISLQLFRERLFGAPDTGRDTVFANDQLRTALDTVRFYLDSAQPAPTVQVNRDRAYLDIRSTGVSGPESVTVQARFGRVLDPLWFSAALTLTGDSALKPFRSDQVRGAIRMKKPMAGITTLPLPAAIQGPNYADDDVAEKYQSLLNQLRGALAAEAAEPGNGEYTSARPPPLSPGKPLSFPLGDVTLRQDGAATWELDGPAVIASEHGIHVRGPVLLKNVTLLTAGDVYFEGGAQGQDVTLFAQGQLILQDQAQVEGLLLSGRNLIVRDRAAVTGNSLVLQAPTTADSSQAIRILGQAAVRGFVVSTGSWGKIVLEGSACRVTGVLLANQIWPAGLIQGSVVAATLRCGAATPGQSCLGDAILDREALPPDFVQPWDFGPVADRSTAQFQLLSFSVP